MADLARGLDIGQPKMSTSPSGSMPLSTKSAKQKSNTKSPSAQTTARSSSPQTSLFGSLRPSTPQISPPAHLRGKRNTSRARIISFGSKGLHSRLVLPTHQRLKLTEYVCMDRIARFTGQSEYVLSADATLTSMTNQKAWSRPPLNLSFSLLMFTSSGLLVRYLKVFEKSNYSSVKWVRYMTRAGSYEIRYVISLSCFGGVTLK